MGKKLFEAEESPEHLKKLPGQITVIKFAGNSTAIPLCARRGQRQNFLAICACIQIWERKDHTKSPSTSLKRRIQSTKA